MVATRKVKNLLDFTLYPDEDDGVLDDEGHEQGEEEEPGANFS